MFASCAFSTGSEPETLGSPAFNVQVPLPHVVLLKLPEKLTFTTAVPACGAPPTVPPATHGIPRPVGPKVKLPEFADPLVEAVAAAPTRRRVSVPAAGAGPG